MARKVALGGKLFKLKLDALKRHRVQAENMSCHFFSICTNVPPELKIYFCMHILYFYVFETAKPHLRV